MSEMTLKKKPIYFKAVWRKIKFLSKVSKNRDLKSRLNKTFEECGEFATAVNTVTGVKALKEPLQAKHRLAVLEEGCDTIQCVIAVLAEMGFTQNDFLKMITAKNFVWEDQIKAQISLGEGNTT